MKLFKGGFEAALYFIVNETTYIPTFCYDLAGRFMVRSPKGNPNTWVPYGFSLVEYTYSELNPLIWEITPAAVEKKLVEYKGQVPAISSLLLDCYPNFTIPTLDEIWVQPSNTEFQEASISQAIDLYDKSQPDIQAKLLASLADCGVHLIPEIESFHDRYHVLPPGEVSTGKVKTIKPGWMSNTKIYQKSTVHPL